MPLFGRQRERLPAVVKPDALAYRTVNPLRRLQARNESLTAAGFRIRPRESEQIRRLVQPWQTRSFTYYDSLGEIKYASQFYARMLSPLRLFAAELDDDGEWVETDHPDAVAALERIQDPGGGRTNLLSSYGRMMFLTGECYLLVSLDEDTGLEQWEFLSPDELRIQGGIYYRYRAPSLQAEELRASTAPSDEEGAWVPVNEDEDGMADGTAVAYRMWQRHPRFSWLADSTMQGVLDLCEELILLTHAVRARARSRIAGSGILLIDDSITSPPTDGADPDEDMQGDPVMAALIEAMMSSIVDEGAASQIVPLLLRAKPGEGQTVKDMIHHLQILDPTQLYPETGLRMECIKRIAIGLDMPPEILLGMQDSNHWTAWQIDEQTWKGHGQPKAQQLCDDLTAAYYRPYLRDVVGLPDWARYAIGYDPAAVINHPDRSKDAKDLYDKRAIGKHALRDAAGFSDDDAPTEDELAEMIGVAVRDSSLAWDGIPSVKAGGLEPTPGTVETADGENTAEDIGDNTGASATTGPPKGDSPPSEPATGPTSLQSSALVSRILGGADIGLVRAREAAGSRVWNLLRKDPDVRDEMARVRRSDLCARLGREKVRALKAPNDLDLVSGARDLILDGFRLYDINGTVAESVAMAVEQYAARTLYDLNPPGLPETLGDYVTGLLARSNGHGG